jgi:hypothetical protein
MTSLLSEGGVSEGVREKVLSTRFLTSRPVTKCLRLSICAKRLFRLADHIGRHRRAGWVKLTSGHCSSNVQAAYLDGRNVSTRQSKTLTSQDTRRGSLDKDRVSKGKEARHRTRIGEPFTAHKTVFIPVHREPMGGCQGSVPYL